MIQTEVLILGCGIAGATAALRLAQNPRRRIVILTRDPDPHESNTRYAQGGIIGRGLDDNADLLVEDILAAGAGATDPRAARILAEEGPSLLQEILERAAGIRFDRGEDGQPTWGKEAAHSRRRILHVGDGTGQAIIQGLIAALQKCPNVTILTHATAVDLITFPHHSLDPLAAYRPVTCYGAYAFDREEHTVHRYVASYDDPGDRRIGPHLSQYHQPARRPRGWAGNGPPRRGAHHQCRVCAVSPHSPVGAGCRRIS